MSRTIEPPALIAVPIGYLKVLLTVLTDAFVAFVAGLGIGSKLFALLARLLPQKRLLESLNACNDCLAQSMLGIGKLC